MKSKKVYKGFTLIELLVVISIIALLMSIMMPALGRARELAKTMLCKSNLKQIGVASGLYVADSGGRIISATYPEHEPKTLPIEMPKGWVMWYEEDVDEVQIFPNGRVLGSGHGLGKYIDMEFKLDKWTNTNVPAKEKNAFNCPSVKHRSEDNPITWPRNIGYGINYEFVEERAEQIKNTQSKVLFADSAYHTISHDRDGYYGGGISDNSHRWYGEKYPYGQTTGEMPVVPGRHNSKDPYTGVVDLLFVDGHADQVKRMDMTRSMFDNDKIESRSGHDAHQAEGFEDR